MVFDNLSGGSTIIKVYPGVSASPGDTKYNGTFNSGENVTAICKTKGRRVMSDPQLGELARTSDYWIRVIGTPNTVQYATAVYVKDSDTLLAKLPDC